MEEDKQKAVHIFFSHKTNGKLQTSEGRDGSGRIGPSPFLLRDTSSYNGNDQGNDRQMSQMNDDSTGACSSAQG